MAPLIAVRKTRFLFNTDARIGFRRGICITGEEEFWRSAINKLLLLLGDGTYRVALGRPVDRLKTEQACQMTGLEARDLRELVETGDLHA